MLYILVKRTAIVSMEPVIELKFTIFGRSDTNLPDKKLVNMAETISLGTSLDGSVSLHPMWCDCNRRQSQSFVFWSESFYR